MTDETLIFVLSKPEIKKLRELGYLDERKIRASQVRLIYGINKKNNANVNETIKELSDRFNIGDEKVKDIIYRKRD
ncbi:MAG TPA: hypothetical protein PLT92_14950 [Ignavibacteriaceae bacterium]|jgi:hypothetical protein|nr:hypothetical protein [Ignavibacteriaceae bacterium]HPO57151.1 hypothetical protein [Ignavibacteriaceae bacterium]